MKLSNETKQALSKMIGIPYEKLIQMDDDEIDKYIKEKLGRRPQWPKGATVDGYPIRTMEEVDKRIESFGNKRNDDFER